ncbi:DUF2569 family protein [Nitrosovibrio tenuis]|uniref:Uncharacterized protein n=1 Tax=Nitrosovibrio tenuis TaxID=1233 RepID=A0A1H7G3T1_9PROT|nr:DUF2569 family protein [Nitrosovibrio tenuis]SEK32704.1 Protein of unknown function [Nitrosovibrio tenuis]
MVGITALGLLALSLPVFASTDTPATSFQTGWIRFLLTLIILIIWFVCASRRKKEIGGWLLYYYIRLYIGAIIVILVIVGRRDSYLSEAWINTPDLYPFFLLTTVPGLLLYCAEIVVAEKLRRSRNYAYVPILRYILFANIVSSLIAIAINDKYFEGSSPGFSTNIMTMIWPIIWIPYFYFSKRVKSVFKNRDWLSG